MLQVFLSGAGNVTPELQSQIQELSLAQLEDLGEALLDFTTQADLVNWLNRLGS
jgi:hypothetical protein